MSPTTAANQRTDRDIRRRTLAQNFLHSRSVVTGFISDCAISSTDTILEIGAGSGTLTDPLVRLAAQVIAIEKDPDWCNKLRDHLTCLANVTVLCGDIRDIALPDKPFRVIANLPFNQTTDLLHLLLDDPASLLQRADLILQWEVALKRSEAARPNLLNLSWRPWFTFHLGRRIPSDSFRPRPATDGGVLIVKRRETPLLSVADRDPFVVLLRNCFQSKGGTLWKGYLRRVLPPRELERLWMRLGLSRAALPGDLKISDWVAIFRATDGLQAPTGGAKPPKRREITRSKLTGRRDPRNPLNRPSFW